MNKLIAFLVVVLAWLVMPIVIVGLTVGLLLGIFWAGSQVLYAYILSELNQRKNNDYWNNYQDFSKEEQAVRRYGCNSYPVSKRWNLYLKKEG